MIPFSAASIYQRQPRWRLALLFWLLCATCLQQWAAQAHWHAAVLHGQATLESPAGDRGDGLPAHDCLLCHAGAHAGSAAPPPVWQALAHFDAARCAPARVAPAAPPCVHPAWNWQIRGPPRA